MNRQAIIEFLILLGAITLVNFIWAPGDLGFTQARPHPYLIVIMVVAVRHGLNAALSSVVALCFALLLLSRQSAFALHLVDLLARPWNFIMANWILLGASVGAAADARRRDHEKVAYNLKVLQSDYADSQKRLELTEAENIELRKKVFGEGETLTTVYEIARGLITLRGQDLFQASLDLVLKFVGTTQCSLYLLDGERGAFVLKETRGLGRFKPPALIPRGDSLIERAFRERRVVSVRDLFSAEKTRQLVESVMVAPIGIREAEEAGEMGVLVIHQLAMDRVNAQTVGVLGLLADWVSRSLNLVQKFEAAENPHAELLAQIQKRRFTTTFIRTLATVSNVREVAVEILCSESYPEIAYWNASKMLGPTTDTTLVGSREELTGALSILLSNGTHLGAVLASLPIHAEFPGCQGLRLRIQERAELNAQATLRILKAYVMQFEGKSLPELDALIREQALSRQQYHLDNFVDLVPFLSKRKYAVAYCLGLNRPEPLNVTAQDLLLSLTHDQDKWTRRLAALASHELQYPVDTEAIENLSHSTAAYDRELGVYLSEMLMSS